MRGRENNQDWEGVLLIDKPCGMTSHDVVLRLRRCLGFKKIGHAGTLDPMASGLLVLLIGKATRISQYLISKDKTYEGSCHLGVTTDTGDSEGQVLTVQDLPQTLSEEDLLKEMATFLGDQYQTPPMFSAKKVKGVPLYKMARKGLEIEREPRFIHVYSFELLSYVKPIVTFSLHCSKGTYVRSIVHDLGQKLACGAYLTELRRIRAGEFAIENARTLEDLENMPLSSLYQSLIPIHEAAVL